jgi:hypothetical protein
LIHYAAEKAGVDIKTNSEIRDFNNAQFPLPLYNPSMTPEGSRIAQRPSGVKKIQRPQ